MYYKEETLFEQYPLELTDTYKGRGAVFAHARYGLSEKHGKSGAVAWGQAPHYARPFYRRF